MIIRLTFLHPMIIKASLLNLKKVAEVAWIFILTILRIKLLESLVRGKDLGLNEDEIAFYDALADNESAKQVLGDDTLKTIARELVEMVRKNVTIDWTERKSVQAKLRLMVKKILRKYGYPPDKQEEATLTVLEQAKLLGYEWVR